MPPKKNHSVGFLFDMDGVLIDSKEFHWQSWDLLQKEVQEFETTYEEFLETFGQRNDMIFKNKIPHSTTEQRKKWGERKEEIFRTLCQGKLQLLPGIETFLQSVQNEGLPKIIASSTTLSNLQFLLKHTKLGEYFNQFVCGDDVYQGKPAPDIFLEAADRLKKDPQQCIVLEDSPAGLEAGKKAKCFVVALCTTHAAEDLSPSSYDMIFPSPEELDLEKILKKFRTFISKDRRG